ncbi:hypothetical protein F4810DRAFT_645629 [Camillea tinctor]|nr:hypothetical protein F4810DRAFT_645629 [Camillea tinctor]
MAQQLQFTGRLYERVARQGERCLACSNVLSTNLGICSRPDGFGCRFCYERGLVCTIRNPDADDEPNAPEFIVLPPYKGESKEVPKVRCPACRQNNRNCDFNRPCDECTRHGVECEGIGRGCFRRLPMPSADFEGYYLSQGFGPTGVNDPNVVPNWTQPRDYHVQYAQWILNKHLAGQPAPPVPLVVVRVDRALYQRVIGMANTANQNAIPVNIPAITARINADMMALKSVYDSEACQDVINYIRQAEENRNVHAMWKPIRYPEGTDFNLLRMLSPGRAFQGGVASIFKTRLDCPITPGPLRPWFLPPAGLSDQDMGIVDNSEYYLAGDPQVVDMARLQRPFPEHPARKRRAPLTSIPIARVWFNGRQYAQDQFCHSVSPPIGAPSMLCAASTRQGCEDASHYEEGYPICDRCEAASRDRFMTQFDSMIMSMRAYACMNCMVDPQVINRFANSGLRIWSNTQIQNQQAIDPSAPNFREAGGHPFGGWMGQPLELTGCSCGMKLMGRRICDPHRLQNLLDIHERVQNMRDYILSVYGRQDNEGCEGRVKMYVCLCCQGVVVDSRPHTGRFPVYSMNSVVAPPPYNPVQQEVEAIPYKQPQNEEEARNWQGFGDAPPGAGQDAPIIHPISVAQRTTSGTVVRPFAPNPQGFA